MDQRRFRVRGIDDYQRVLDLLGYYSASRLVAFRKQTAWVTQWVTDADWQRCSRHISGFTRSRTVVMLALVVIHVWTQVCIHTFTILGVRSLANASRARQFNPLNPPGVGWVPLPQTNMAAVVGRARSCVVGRARSCAVVRAWSVVRGSACSCVVVRGRAWSCAVVRAWSVMRGSAWSCVVGRAWSQSVRLQIRPWNWAMCIYFQRTTTLLCWTRFSDAYCFFRCF